MSVLEGIILGIVQGITEFIPVSSSAHLTLFQRLFGINEGTMTFNIILHMATLLAVLVVFRRDIMEIIKRPFSKMPLLIVAGTIPTVIIVLLFNDLINSLFSSGKVMGISFFITGSALWWAQTSGRGGKELKEMTYLDAIIIGVAQGFAILPGISRLGFTLTASLVRGLNKRFALKFSFLMSIPIIVGAALKDVYDILKGGTGFLAGIQVAPVAAGFLVAALCGFFAVGFMLKHFKKVNLKCFSYYVFALGTFVLIDQIFFGKFFPRFF